MVNKMVEFYAELLKKDGEIERIQLGNSGLFANETLTFSCDKKGERYVCSAKFSSKTDVVGYAIESRISLPLRFEKSKFFSPACWYGEISAPSKFSLTGKLQAGV